MVRSPAPRHSMVPPLSRLDHQCESIQESIRIEKTHGPALRHRTQCPRWPQGRRTNAQGGSGTGEILPELVLSADRNNQPQGIKPSKERRSGCGRVCAVPAASWSLAVFDEFVEHLVGFGQRCGPVELAESFFDSVGDRDLRMRVAEGKQ
jgi:hypothetical protein